MSIAALPGLPVLPRKAKGAYCIWLGNVVSAPETADRILPPAEANENTASLLARHSLCGILILSHPNTCSLIS